MSQQEQQVLEYATPPPTERGPGAVVRLAMACAVLLPILNLIGFGADVEMRARTWERFESDWHHNELMRRAYERDQRAAGFPVSAKPPRPPEPPTLRRGLLAALPAMRVALVFAAALLSIALSSRGWPAVAPAWVKRLAWAVCALASVMLVLMVVAYGWDRYGHDLGPTGAALLGIVSAFGLVAPVCLRRGASAS
jgi:hypothetical protein